MEELEMEFCFMNKDNILGSGVSAMWKSKEMNVFKM